jgi:hypothetical protein
MKNRETAEKEKTKKNLGSILTGPGPYVEDAGAL